MLYIIKLLLLLLKYSFWFICSPAWGCHFVHKRRQSLVLAVQQDRSQFTSTFESLGCVLPSTHASHALMRSDALSHFVSTPLPWAIQRGDGLRPALFRARCRCDGTCLWHSPQEPYRPHRPAKDKQRRQGGKRHAYLAPLGVGRLATHNTGGPSRVALCSHFICGRYKPARRVSLTRQRQALSDRKMARRDSRAPLRSLRERAATRGLPSIRLPDSAMRRHCPTRSRRRYRVVCAATPLRSATCTCAALCASAIGGTGQSYRSRRAPPWAPLRPARRGWRRGRRWRRRRCRAGKPASGRSDETASMRSSAWNARRRTGYVKKRTRRHGGAFGLYSFWHTDPSASSMCADMCVRWGLNLCAYPSLLPGEPKPQGGPPQERVAYAQLLIWPAHISGATVSNRSDIQRALLPKGPLSRPWMKSTRGGPATAFISGGDAWGRRRTGPTTMMLD